MEDLIMACTTILAGKKATYNGSTMIARNDDGFFDVKKLVIVDSKKQPRKYKSKIAHLTIDLPDNPLRYTSTPSVDLSSGIWAANGINELNVAMTATETVTTNPLVMGADPYVKYQKAKGNKKEVPGGIGEEDLVVLVLPYIKSAREGVLRLGSLLETYGTYESNGIAFSDKDEIWWLETIGGHHWIARRVKDEEVVIMPNQFGLDCFDMEDALNEGKENLCSKDLKEFIEKNHLLMDGERFNPRVAFGSHSDADHVYNTPRGWYMGRYFNPTKYKWDGENADFNPQSDNIPWSFIPEKKVTVEDIKYVLSSYYQGTPYNPHGKDPKKGIYRPIGISRTGVMAVLEIRNNVPKEISAIEWICFGCNAYNAMIPLYADVDRLPAYVSNTTLTVDTNSFYWTSRLIAAMGDQNFKTCVMDIERYQGAMANKGHQLINEYDAKILETKDYSLKYEANNKLCEMAKEEADNALNKILMDASKNMTVGYSRADN
ncbi:MAG: C69 family dipeptidase [Erysipelotrichaceae bacterium]|nr:C69 family dipeptidase [Erysipelotrichaceae bacterium]